MMQMSYSAEKVLPGSFRRTWLSWGSLISNPCCPSMPISKAILLDFVQRLSSKQFNGIQQIENRSILDPLASGRARQSSASHLWPGHAAPRMPPSPAPPGILLQVRCLPAPCRRWRGRTRSAGPGDRTCRATRIVQSPQGCHPLAEDGAQFLRARVFPAPFNSPRAGSCLDHGADIECLRSSGSPGPPHTGRAMYT
jgi:hypothetical protein